MPSTDLNEPGSFFLIRPVNRPGANWKTVASLADVATPADTRPKWQGLLSTFRGSSLRTTVRGQAKQTPAVSVVLTDLQDLLTSTRQIHQLKPLLDELLLEMQTAGNPLSAGQVAALNTVLADNNFNITIKAP